MTRTLTTSAAALTLVAGIASADHVQDFTAIISSGVQQATDSGSPAMGTLEGTYDSIANTFAFNWSISDDLIGLPSSPGAHLHMAPAGSAGPVVFAFNDPDGGWDLSGSATWTGLSTDQVDALYAGNIYANFHTDAFPAGEVRGQISVVPSPGGTAALAMMGMGAIRRRRR